MDYYYELVDGKYVLHYDGEALGPALDEVALCFDCKDGVLHKHGSVELVQAWQVSSQDRLRAGRLPDLADDLIVIYGRFDLEELNRCLLTTGYVGRFFKRLCDEEGGQG